MKTRKTTEEVSVKIEHIVDYALKAKYIKDMYANITVDINDEEILESDVWVILGKEDDKCYALFMLQKKDMDGYFAEVSVRITHMALKAELFEQSMFLYFYLQIETYYVNNNVEYINIIIPKIRGFTTKAAKFFKKVGFVDFIRYDAQFPDGAVQLFKNKLKKWYTEEGGKYKPRITTDIPAPS